MDQNPSSKETRPPINLRIKFRSDTVEQFIERYAVDVSRGGIFIRTKEPLAVGTQLKLDFQFQNGGALMSGDGTVVWIREFDPNRATVPPGMGVRFDKLTTESQAVLEQLLAEKAKRERGAVPGSGAGGMAIRRPSSMFSVLEPQVSVSEASSPDKPAPAASEDAARQDAPGSRPLGNARNPLAAGAAKEEARGPAATAGRPAPGLAPLVGTSGPGARGASTPTPTPAGGRMFGGNPGGIAGGRPSQRPTPNDDESSPFDEHDEPTQIAGRLPSFLSEREASSLGKATVQKSADADLSARAPLPGATSEQSDHRDIGPGTKQPVTTPASTTTAAEDQHAGAPHTGARAAEPAHHQLSREELLPIGGFSPAITVRDTVRDLPADAGSAASAHAGTAAANPPPAAQEANLGGGASTAAARAARRRSPAAIVGVTVLVLGAAAIFLFRFFGSHAIESGTSSSGTAALVGPATPAAAPVPTPPAPTEPTATNAATPPGAGNPAGQPTGAPDNQGQVQGQVQGQGQGQPQAPTNVPPAAAAPAGEAKADEPAPPAPKVAARHRPSRTIKDPAASSAAAVAPPETRPAEAPTPPSAVIAAPRVEAATATPPSDTEPPSHEIRITSKPVGADVALDGQPVGKTPYSVAIPDVTAPHIIAVRKDGFEPFEQMISASSAWSKTKPAKGKPAVQVLKISAKLKQVGGPENKPPAGEAPAAAGEAVPKSDVQRADRPLPPSDERLPATPQ